MHIAVDARELCGKPAGVGRYLAELIAEWSASDAARRHRWTLVAHQSLPVRPPLPCEVRVVPGAGGTAWEQWALARALQGLAPDLLFAPGYTAPINPGCLVALTVHDLSFCAHPEWYSFREGWRRRILTRRSARHAAVVLTDSQFSASEIVRHTGVAAARIRTIPLGVRPRGGAPSGAREPLVLYVGSIFERRHVDWLIDGFARTVAPAVPDARLAIVGENRLRDAGALDAWLGGRPAPVRDRIAVHAYVDEPTLEGLYRRASVFAFPSEYEGFGLAPLEALSAGVPPVVLDTAVAREIYGAAACYAGGQVMNVNSGSGHEHDAAGAIGAAILDLLTSPAAREAVLGHAPTVLSRYDWARTAGATLAALEDCAGG